MAEKTERVKRIEKILKRVKLSLSDVIEEINMPADNILKIKSHHSGIIDDILDSLGPAIAHSDGFYYRVQKTSFEIRGGKCYTLFILPERDMEHLVGKAAHDFAMHLSRAAHNYTHTHQKPYRKSL